MCHVAIVVVWFLRRQKLDLDLLHRFSLFVEVLSKALNFLDRDSLWRICFNLGCLDSFLLWNKVMINLIVMKLVNLLLRVKLVNVWLAVVVVDQLLGFISFLRLSRLHSKYAANLRLANNWHLRCLFSFLLISAKLEFGSRRLVLGSVEAGRLLAAVSFRGFVVGVEQRCLISLCRLLGSVKNLGGDSWLVIWFLFSHIPAAEVIEVVAWLDWISHSVVVLGVLIVCGKGFDNVGLDFGLGLGRLYLLVNLPTCWLDSALRWRK